MSPRRLAIALGISVALNLFLLGLGAARLWRGGVFGHAPSARRGPPGPDRFARVPSRTPGGRRGSARGAGQPVGMPWLEDEQRRDLQARRKALRVAREQVRTALLARDFDRLKLERGFAEVRAKSLAVQEFLHAELAGRAQGLPLEERRRLSNRERRRGRARTREPAP